MYVPRYREAQFVEKGDYVNIGGIDVEVIDSHYVNDDTHVSLSVIWPGGRIRDYALADQTPVLVTGSIFL